MNIHERNILDGKYSEFASGFFNRAYYDMTDIVKAYKEQIEYLEMICSSEEPKKPEMGVLPTSGDNLESQIMSIAQKYAKNYSDYLQKMSEHSAAKADAYNKLPVYVEEIYLIMRSELRLNEAAFNVMCTYVNEKRDETRHNISLLWEELSHLYNSVIDPILDYYRE